MSGKQIAGTSIQNVNIDGNNNTVIFESPGLDSELAKVSAGREYKILICIPSAASRQEDWLAFADALASALRSKGFEVVRAGGEVPRDDDELIYIAEQRHLQERGCHALLILACDHVTLSQLTHLTSVAFGKGKARKEVMVIHDGSLLNGKQYFEEGALKAVQNMGKVFVTEGGLPPSQKMIEDIVRQFNTNRFVMR